MTSPTLRVLLVEDNPDDARLLAFELESADYALHVESASTEADYREKLAARPDIILADYTLPRFGAMAAVRILRELSLDIPLIVVTGSIGEDRAVECIHLGAADYLLKDRLTRLGPAVKRALLEKQARDAKRAAEEALHERLRFEELMSALSTQLIHTHSNDIDAVLTQVLGVVGEFYRADRVVVRKLDAAQRTLDLTHQWSAPDTTIGIAADSYSLDSFDWAVEQTWEDAFLLAHRDSVPPHIASLKPAMERAGMDTLAVLPLRLENHTVGTIALQWRVFPKLSAEAVGRVGLLADIVANALARQRADEQRDRAFQELDRLKRAAEHERDYLREELRESGAGAIIGESGPLSKVLEMVDAVAPTRATVLIRGESGVGKEVIARVVHERSGRTNGPLVKVNCASIPRDLFESEFFGHVKGSFTGALRNRAGRFELADGGTIFLDEVGEIPMDMQSKLLRVLQESEFERVGDDRTQRVDVRVIAATNRDLDAQVQAGTFRRDLYYRLNVFPIEVPALRARRADIGVLADFFLKRCCRDMRRAPLSLSGDQRKLLEAHDWPGNVRELEHVIERAVILSPLPPLRLDLALAISSVAAPPEKQVGPISSAARLQMEAGVIMSDADFRTVERDNIVAALQQTSYQISGAGGAAELLGLSPSTLRDRMKALNVHRPEG